MKFIKMIFSKEIILYIIFGILSTLINFGTSFALEKYCHVNGSLASMIGIALAVLFAYFTNRKLVFNSTATTSAEKTSEFGKFVLGRTFTILIEEVGVIVFFSVVGFPFLLVKLIFMIIAIILNFIISKIYAFK